ncbi:MAG: hypothetical protein JWQ87_4956 [Candidatus Sulfotelmatobacter sp.]|nr:hypothetical protein [Candidatus Sulfotelmatobacter sp.]
MKLRLAGVLVAALAVGCTIVRLMRSDRSEVLLSPGVALTPDWKEIRLVHGLETTAEWSELLVEMPSPQFGQIGGQLVRQDGAQIHIDGYLATEKGEKVNLDRGRALAYGSRIFVRLSAPALEWKRCDYRFRTVALRADLGVQTGRMIWMSYNPRTTKDGVAFPER